MTLDLTTIIQVVLVIGLCLLSYLIIEAVRSLILIRKILSRVDLIMDVKSWLGVLKWLKDKKSA